MCFACRGVFPLAVEFHCAEACHEFPTRAGKNCALKRPQLIAIWRALLRSLFQNRAVRMIKSSDLSRRFVIAHRSDRVGFWYKLVLAAISRSGTGWYRDWGRVTGRQFQRSFCKRLSVQKACAGPYLKRVISTFYWLHWLHMQIVFPKRWALRHTDQLFLDNASTGYI